MSKEFFQPDLFPRVRPRRNRLTGAIRGLVRESYLLPGQLIAPLFVVEGENQKQIISSMPGIYRYSIDFLLEEISGLINLGIRAVNLFCMVDESKKDSLGSEAVREGNLLQRAIRAVKAAFPGICLMVDIALDPYTNHGHDGIVNAKGIVDTNLSLPVLAQMSVLAAEAGADLVAPSDMMDGRVGYIRAILDQKGFSDVGILSYTAKYASAFYGPFRDALGSAPKFGDKKTYQLNPANGREALYECLLDESEGADLILVKPALAYLDIIAKIREQTFLPVGAYHVSGEYAMVMAAAEKGWLDANRVFEESLLAIKRAGADFILTYAARQVAEYWRDRS